jgi:hypothetical protein
MDRLSRHALDGHKKDQKQRTVCVCVCVYVCLFVEILASVQGMDAITNARVSGDGGISLSSAEMGAFGKRGGLVFSLCAQLSRACLGTLWFVTGY